MIELIGVTIISPIWGFVSTLLFLQCWLAFVSMIMSIISLITGKVGRKNSLMFLGIYLLQGIVSSICLKLGYWLLSSVLSFGYTTIENIIYWIFAVIALIGLLPQIPNTIRRVWHNTSLPGIFELNLLLRTRNR